MKGFGMIMILLGTFVCGVAIGWASITDVSGLERVVTFIIGLCGAVSGVFVRSLK